MEDNIQIIPVDPITFELQDYSTQDTNIISKFEIDTIFSQSTDYIEYYVYDIAENILNTNYNYLSFKIPNTSYLNTDGTLPIIEIDPIKDLQNIGYSSGEFIVKYNFFNNKVSDYLNTGLFIKEISSDRTELRLGSTTLSNAEIENTVLSIINE
jgi:hypothetical protein